MTDPTTPDADPALTAVHAALADLAAALAPNAPPAAADKLTEHRAALAAALRKATEAAADPDPPEERPRDPVADVVTAIDVQTAAELLQHPDRLLLAIRKAEDAALAAGGLDAGPVALARVMRAGDRGEAAAADLVKLAERELARRDRAAKRRRRDALLLADSAEHDAKTARDLLRGARTALDAVRAMRPIVAVARDDPDRRRLVALADVQGDLPAALVSCADRNGRRDGALVSAGTVGILAGAGGSAKTTLALHLAIEAASTPAGTDRAALGGALVVAGGPVLLATYEDAAPVVRTRAARLVELLQEAAADFGMRDAMSRVHLLDLAARPLFGPVPGEDGRPAFYNARPGPLPGWADLWAAVDEAGARLVVIDPALAAYVGESNAAAPVREFIGALATEAAKRRAGVLLIAHSTKAARAGGPARPSLYDPGMIGGSSHWTDGCRAALHLVEARDDGPDTWRLAVAKANYGPAFQHATLHPIRHGRGAIAGFLSAPADGTAEHWRRGEPPKPKAEGKPSAAGIVDPAGIA